MHGRLCLQLILTVFFIARVGGRAQEAPVPPPPGPAGPPALEVTAESPVEPSGDPSVAAPATPQSLQAWADWVLHGQPGRDEPPLFSDAGSRLPLWPSRLQFDAQADGAEFSLEVEAFAERWLTLPGSTAHWPVEVQLDGMAVPVLERDKRPAIRLAQGKQRVSGRFQWKELPQQIALPPEVGLLALRVNGQEMAAPSWEPNGTLWLQRQASTEPVDEDYLSLQVHSLLEDGIPLWFETRIELIVAGKSREERIGTVLPEGWQLASVESPLPVAIDGSGLLHGQIRAGRWSIVLRAFRTSAPESIAFAEGARPPVEDQSLAFRARPEFRQAEVTGLPQIDASQTQVPGEWRSLPVYRWETSNPFQLVERVRGPGDRRSAPVAIQRTLWLDEDGRAFTFRDQLTGPLREIRRFDVAEGHQLGSVEVGGTPQLITHHPETGAAGFEVRSAHLLAVATGRAEMRVPLSATGWQADADSLSARLHLPPGYRMLALPGADYSTGDWLTAWSLFDLFLLLLFTLAVFRLRGFSAGLLAFIAFGLAYHESGAPRFSWLVLLIPVALVTALPEGRWRNLANAGKWMAAALLLLTLAPFAARQIQAAIFPQLEQIRSQGGWDGIVSGSDALPAPARVVMERNAQESSSKVQKFAYKDAENLKADPKAAIQTGPGVPTWSWRTISFGWDGPVTQAQTVRPLLIPPLVTRVLGILRVLSLVLLAVLLLTGRRRPGTAPAPKGEGPLVPSGAAPKLALWILGAGLLSASPTPAQAQYPSPALLEELAKRLQEIPDAFPRAADLAGAELQLQGEAFTLTLDYHAGARCAVPVPLPLTALVPAEASFAQGESPALLRESGQLWVLLPEPGLHQLTLRGRLREVGEWEWSFPLKPRRVRVAAEGWTVSGLRADGSVEEQLLFTRVLDQAASASTTAAYERPDTKHALLVERQIEMGLVWRVHTKVRRLSPKGRAAAIRVPLLPGEKVVSQGRNVSEGAIEVRLAPGAEEVSWEGELAPVNELSLATRESDSWTEEWRLVASSVWNVGFAGLAPVYEQIDEQLVPLWQPWPGESAQLTISRPQAVDGAVVTIDSAKQVLTPGRRQRSARLELSLRTSLGEDFAIRLPAGAEITALNHDGRSLPVRKEGDDLVVPLKPGAQRLEVEWRRPSEETFWTAVDPVGLPVEAANVSTEIHPSSDRWLLWAKGPQHGPAFRFWGVLVFSLLVALVLSRVPASPLRLREWLLLSLGLTQVPVFAALLFVAWLFFIRWRGSDRFQRWPTWAYNLSEVALILLSLVSIGIFIGIASVGLLGDPQMYIAGNHSSASRLAWYSPRSDGALPLAGYFSVSEWWYRIAMLLWALWLAAALVRWLRLGWHHSSRGGHFRKSEKKRRPTAPPDLPEPTHPA